MGVHFGNIMMALAEHQTIVEKPSLQTTGGMMMVMPRNQEYNDAEFKVITRMENRHWLILENGFLEYCLAIQEDLAHLITALPFCAEHIPTTRALEFGGIG
jgi:hypothetical protein